MNKYRKEFLKEKEQDFLRETTDVSSEEIEIEKNFNDSISEILEDIEEYNNEQKKEILNFLNKITLKAKSSVLRKKREQIKEQIKRAVKTNIKNFTSF